MKHCPLLLMTLLLSGILASVHSSKPLGPGVKYDEREYCETELFEPRCGEGEVLMITEARYGRMRLGRCVETDYGYLGCQADVLQHLDSACGGRATCALRIPDNELDRTNHSCPNEFKTYLNVSHKCIPVETNACLACPTTQTAHLTHPRAYIASATTAAAHRSRYPCGSSRCPWRIEARSGQTINLTLFDFAMEERRRGSQGHIPVSTETGASCYRYAVIKEETSVRDTPICGGRGRQQAVYASVTNVIEVHIVSPEVFSMLGHFMLHYQAVGCPDYVPSDNEWVKRRGANLEIGCLGSPDTWQLVCNDTQWTGAMKACPETHHVTPTVPPTILTLSVGLLIAIVSGIAFVVAVLIVTVGVVWLKRKRSALPSDIDTYYPQRLEMQCYELSDTFQSDIPTTSLRKPPTAGTPKSRQNPRHAPPLGRHNLYGAPRMDQRPLPSLPSDVESCSVGGTRVVKADINSMERANRDRIAHESGVGGARQGALTRTGSRATASVDTSNPQPTASAAGPASGAFGGLQQAPQQHYTVLDPIEMRQFGAAEGASLAAPAGICGHGGGLGGVGGADACAQSYRSHSDDGGSSGGGSSEEGHSSCQEIPLRPMREGSQQQQQQANETNSGNCSWP